MRYKSKTAGKSQQLAGGFALKRPLSTGAQEHISRPASCLCASHVVDFHPILKLVPVLVCSP
ncbi:MAG TPA: hypothetical protein VF762_24230, partial [Blastocatellia bacterium]